MFSEALTRAWKPIGLDAPIVQSNSPSAKADGDAGSELPDEALEHVAGGRSPAWVEDFLTRRARGDGVTA